jgi:hypothetical protein
MRQHLPLILILGLCLVPTIAAATAFEEHSSWGKEPWLETEKGVSLDMSVLEMSTGMRFLRSNTFFNSNGNMADSPAEFDIYTWDLAWRFGYTENWTIWGNLPLIWSEQTNAPRERKAEGKLGDAETGILYQFYRRNDPTLSMGLSLRWKLPTGSEVPGTNNLNITGTGTTDIELSYIGRVQLFRNLALGWSVGYNLRFPGPVQYIIDRHTPITNAWIDLGDEINAELDVIAGIEYVALHLKARFSYRFATQMAVPEFRAETVRWTDPTTGDEMSEEYMLYNGARYEDWDVLSPRGQTVASDGYAFTLTPKIIIRPVEWFDFLLWVNIHLMGKNSVYLVDNDGTNPTIDNFAPMQTLGKKIQPLGKKAATVIGELGFHALVRW